jgi:hypothetical protein
MKKRFYALATILRVRSLEQASKLIQCCFILHNMCLEVGDNGEDLEEVDYNGQNPAAHVVQQDPPVLINQVATRRQELLQTFIQRHAQAR